VAERKENFSGSGKRAAIFAATFICLLHPLFSSQTDLKSMQLPTRSQWELGRDQTLPAPVSL